MNADLSQLFWPMHAGAPFLDITPGQAAAALRNYLTTGEPNWKEALQHDELEGWRLGDL